jgi:hypothetical protein
MLEFILILLAVVGGGIILLMLTSIFVAYITQAEYIDDHQFGDNNDD